MLDVLKRLPLIERLRRAVRHDVDQAVKPLRKELRQLSRQVEQLEAALNEAAARAARGDRHASQIKWTLMADAVQQPSIGALDDILDEQRIAAHVRHAIAAAPMMRDPFDHIVVERILPDDVYQLLLQAIPPTMFFTDADPVKQDLRVPIEQAEQMYLALKKRRVPAMFIRYPDTYHGGWTPWNTVHRYHYELKWWEKYLGAKTAAGQ